MKITSLRSTPLKSSEYHWGTTLGRECRNALPSKHHGVGISDRAPGIYNGDTVTVPVYNENDINPIEITRPQLAQLLLTKLYITTQNIMFF